ncbi:MAG: hypothetical protein CMP23_16235 [Rickettsiales bacterium]|nr:hypothetical protein [Rickettsiales bacterium]
MRRCPRHKRTPSSCRILLFAGWICGLVIWGASTGAAADYNICVEASGLSPISGCGESCTDLTSTPTTVSSALAEAATLPNYISDDDATERRPEVQVCITGQAPHHELIHIDESEQLIGDPLILANDEDVPLCPPPSSELQPVIYWQLNGAANSTPLLSVNLDLRSEGPCPESNSPGVLFELGEGYGRVQLQNSVIMGSKHYAISSDSSAQAVSLQLEDVHIVQCEGAAVLSSGDLQLHTSEVTGCLLRPAVGGANALIQSSPGHRLQIRASTFFGNLIDADGIEAEAKAALIRGNLNPGIDRSVFAANILAGQAVLIDSELTPLLTDVDETGKAKIFSGSSLTRTVFSRNRKVSSLSGEQPEPALPARWGSAGLDEATPFCAGLDQNQPYIDRPSPASDAETTTGPLIELRAESLNHPLHIQLSHSFLVENELGGGTLVSLRGNRPNLSVQLLNNTIANNDAAAIVELSDQLRESEIVAARNLFVPPTEATSDLPLLKLASAPRSMTITMNISKEQQTWVTAELASSSWYSIVGPNPELPELNFVTPSSLAPTQSACDRFADSCPGHSKTECNTLPWVELPCAADRAAHWLPTAESWLGLPAVWPWETKTCGNKSSPIAAGATAGVCSSNRLYYDRLGSFGDGDGYPDLIDCDNEDALIFPQHPLDDGFSSNYCDDIEATCYNCPPGTEPRPPTSENEGADEPYPGDYHLVHPGCYQGGCGISYNCEGPTESSAAAPAEALLCLALPLARRRRKAAPTEPRTSNPSTFLARRPSHDQ